MFFQQLFGFGRIFGLLFGRTFRPKHVSVGLYLYRSETEANVDLCLLLLDVGAEHGLHESEVVRVHPSEGGRHHGHGLLHRQLRVAVLAHHGVEERLQRRDIMVFLPEAKPTGLVAVLSVCVD